MTITADRTVLRETRHHAGVLRSIASHWDQWIYEWDAKHPNIPVETVLNKLISLAGEYTAPDMKRDDIYMYMTDLRDAVHALARYEVGDGWDGDEDDERQHYSDETVVAILNRDIDDALYPLLAGGSIAHACSKCRKTHSDVWTWRQRQAGSSYCPEHQS